MFFTVGGNRASGVRVLLVHGCGGQSDVWDFLLPHLEARCWYAAVDLPGCARARKETLPRYDLDAYADWMADRLPFGGEPPTHVVGHSLGSIMGLHMVRRRAWEGTKVVMLNPPLWSDPEQAREATARHSRAFGLMTRRPYAMSRWLLPVLDCASRLGRRLWEPGDPDTRWFLDNLRNYTYRGYSETVRQCVLRDLRAHVAARARRSDTCVVMGRRDPLFEGQRPLRHCCSWVWTEGSHGSDTHAELPAILARLLWGDEPDQATTGERREAAQRHQAGAPESH